MKILIATSGRPSAEPAVRQGAYVAKALGIRPTLLLVQENAHEEGRAALDQAEAMLNELGVQADTRLREGHAAEGIVAEVQAGGFDMAILGEGHKPRFLDRVFGDTTKQVLGAMPCSILIAKGISQHFERILVCDSLVSQGGLVMAFLENFVDLLSEEKQITILHVMSQMGAGPTVQGWELRADVDELIQAATIEGQLITEDLAKFREQDRVHPVAKIRHGLVLDEVVKETQEGHHDLLVLGAHREESWQRFLLEDLAGDIVAHSQVPVLVLPRHLIPKRETPQ